MSGAQGKAVDIAGGVSIIAEVDASRIQTRHDQGWVERRSSTIRLKPSRWRTTAASRNAGRAIAFHGNVVDLLEYAVAQRPAIDLLSDQTSCHAAYDGGYCPQGLTFEERTELLKTDRVKFQATGRSHP